LINIETKSKQKLKLRNILHLDDHKIFFDGISGVLKKEFPNLSLHHIENGNEALQYVADCLNDKKTIDLIITDIIHPGIDGIEFAKAVRELENHSNNKIPILFITMIDNKGFQQKAKAIEQVKYLLKNAQGKEIIAAINDLLITI